MDSGYGHQTLFDGTSDTNVMMFMVRAFIEQMSTMRLVKVQAVHGGGTGESPGTVDVLPLVKMIDGVGNVASHQTVYGLPWYRMQGGTGAVVCDPKVDDFGYVVCADRDSSAVIKQKAEAQPGSWRTFDLADGVYVGGVLNAAPEQYVAFTDDGIVIKDKNGNKMEWTSSGISFTATRITCNGAVIAGFGGADQVSLQTHVHPTAAAGPPSPPTPGT